MKGAFFASAVVLLSFVPGAQAQTAHEATQAMPTRTGIADGAAPGADVAPDGRPPLPPSLLTMVTLGNAGLLQSTFSLERSAIAETRVGEARASIGFANSSGILSGYRDHDRALVLPVAITKTLDFGGGGATFLRVAAAATIADAERNLQWNDGDVLRNDVQLLHAPDPSTLIGLGLVYKRIRVDNHYSLPGQEGSSDRDGWGARLDVAKKMSDHFGFTARAEYSTGDYKVAIPAVDFRHVQNLSAYYAQAELVGTIGHQDMSVVPAGWTLHPTLGANFHSGDFERTANSFGVVSGSVIGPSERYGTVWGDLRLEKAAAMAPGVQILPFVTVGIEREYVNNLDRLIREPTYGHVATGFALMTGGQRIDVAYNNNFGLHNRRSIQNLVISTAITW